MKNFYYHKELGIIWQIRGHFVSSAGCQINAAVSGLDRRC